MSATIVSAFVSNVNSFRNVEQYIDYGRRLLKTNDIKKIIFIEKSVYDQYLHDNNYQNTHFVFIEKNDIYLYEHIDKITEFDMTSCNPMKDTLEYMFVQSNKTEWIKQAIELDPFQTEQFIWVDFGIYHMMNIDFGKYDIIDDDEFNELIYKMTQKNYQQVRAGGCWDLNSYYHQEYYTQPMWYFGGSVFGGDKASLCKFADLMKQRCLNIISERKTFVWEVNIWYIIYLENKELFDIYRTYEHGKIMVSKY